VLAVGSGGLKALRDDCVLDGVSADLPWDFELFCRFPPSTYRSTRAARSGLSVVRPERRSARTPDRQDSRSSLVSIGFTRFAIRLLSAMRDLREPTARIGLDGTPPSCQRVA
jgi:hypothetical protein